jgi:hypothetical protein
MAMGYRPKSLESRRPAKLTTTVGSADDVLAFVEGPVSMCSTVAASSRVTVPVCLSQKPDSIRRLRLLGCRSALDSLESTLANSPEILGSLSIVLSAPDLA